MRDYYIAWDDLKKVFEKKKRTLLRLSLLGSIFLFLNFLFIPPRYEASATFKQGIPRVEQGVDFKNFIRSFSSTGSEETTAYLILSRAVLTKTIEELGLQAEVKMDTRLKTIRNNLLTELGLKTPDHDGFTFKNVSYEGEKTISSDLRFTSLHTFEIDGLKGKVCEPVSFQGVTFTLSKVPHSLKLNKNYRITFHPRRGMVQELRRNIGIKRLQEDKNILLLQFAHKNRHLAADLINTLMSKYEEFLIEENKTVIGAQIKYLEKRQDELGAKLDLDMKEHVALMKQNFMKHGFLGVQKEIESLLQPLQSYRGRVDNIDVEMEGLKKRMIEKTSIPVEAHPKLVEKFGQQFAHQIEDLRSILQKIGTEDSLPTSVLEQVWHYEQPPSNKEQLSSHVHFLIEHLTLRQKNLEESCQYIEKLETDFRGMTIEAARRLFGEYCQQLDNLQAQLKQVIFFRDHLHKPDFEISTLSNLLTDSVTEFLIQKAGKIEAELCDSINRSSKEHHRLKEALIIQKRFLESHLSQILELGKIRIQLIQEKIASLYTVMKDLLFKEKDVLEYKISQLKNTLQEIPELWHLDKRLQFKADLTQGMMEGLTNIAETKNLSRHLYQVESKPLDLAESPLQPKSPLIFFKTLGGGILIGMIFYLFFLFLEFIKGLPTSLSTVFHMGGHISGSLSSREIPFDNIPDQDLQTVRKLASFLLERKKDKPTVVALLSKKDSEFCFNLAHLLQFHNQKISIIDCDMDRIVHVEDQPGLWQYLNHAVSEAPFRHRNECDYLPAGGTTQHTHEYLARPEFIELLQLRRNDDFIFLKRQVALDSIDALQMTQLSDLAIITLHDEPQKILIPFIQLPRQKQNFDVTFTAYV